MLKPTATRRISNFPWNNLKMSTNWISKKCWREQFRLTLFAFVENRWDADMVDHRLCTKTLMKLEESKMFTTQSFWLKLEFLNQKGFFLILLKYNWMRILEKRWKKLLNLWVFLSIWLFKVYNFSFNKNYAIFTKLKMYINSKLAKT